MWDKIIYPIPNFNDLTIEPRRNMNLFGYSIDYRDKVRGAQTRIFRDTSALHRQDINDLVIENGD